MVELVYVCIWWDWYVVKQNRSCVTCVLCYGYNIIHAFEFYLRFHEKKNRFFNMPSNTSYFWRYCSFSHFITCFGELSILLANWWPFRCIQYFSCVLDKIDKAEICVEWLGIIRILFWPVSLPPLTVHATRGDTSSGGTLTHLERAAYLNQIVCRLTGQADILQHDTTWNKRTNTNLI